jgi:predicted Ser/Thr protein kinase
VETKSTLWVAGRYEILSELGRGGMSTVYLARQIDLDREVALKELSGLYLRDSSFLDRFLHESRVAGSLNHPNIVTVHEYFEHEGAPYIAMEFVDGGSLRPLVGTLTLPQIFGVLEQLCSGLAYAESKGIVHRDLKPENVMVTGEGKVKIADFGIAKAINEAAPGRFVTGTGMMLGTPAYMAPEQALGTGIGPWSDLYSLGVMAYEMLVGQVPFHDTPAPMAILVKHMHEEIPSPRTVNPAVDPELSVWIERLLVKEPENRTRRASDAWEELEEIVLSELGPRWRREARLPVAHVVNETLTALTPAPPAGDGPRTVQSGEDAGASGTAVPGSAATRVASAAPAAVAEPVPAPQEPRRAGRRRWLLAAGALAAVAAAAVAVVLVVSGGKSDEQRTVAEPGATTAEAASPATTAPATSGAGDSAAAPLPELEPVGAAAGTGVLAVSNPNGFVATLNPRTLEQVGVLSDPALPGAIATSGSELIVADGEAVSVYQSAGLEPKGAARFDEGALLAARGGTVAAARGRGAAGGRLCVLSDTRLDPCLDLDFRPAGIGITTDGSRILIASGSGEPTVVPFGVEADRLVEQEPIALEAKPTGAPVEFRGSVYVPVEGGVAVIDLAASSVSSSIALPATPAAIAIAASSGKLFAALPGANQVAVLDTLDSQAEPALEAVGEQPAALTGRGDVVYVLNAGDGSITRLDALTGDVLGTARIPALGREGSPKPVDVARMRMEESSKAVTVTLELDGGRLPASGILVPDRNLADGAALVELWQGGISSSVGDAATSGGLETQVAGALGRVSVRLSAAADAFRTVEVRRSGNGSAVVITAAKAPPPPTTESTSTEPAPAEPAPAPEPATEPQPNPGITVG